MPARLTLESDQSCLYAGASPCHLTLPLIHSISHLYSTYILLDPHKVMYPPPRPSTPIQSSGKARETEPSPEDDLLAITGSGLRPSLSIITPSEAASSPDISPHTLPTASSTRSRSLYAGVRFHDPPSTDDLLRLPQSTSPKPRNPASTPSSLSARPDELIYTMPQYQPVSAGSTNAPRTMSQVSPGFIFVNFLSQSVCCFLSFLDLTIGWYFLDHVSYSLSPVSFVPRIISRALIALLDNN